jgi:hypothetical protein
MPTKDFFIISILYNQASTQMPDLFVIVTLSDIFSVIFYIANRWCHFSIDRL